MTIMPHDSTTFQKPHLGVNEALGGHLDVNHNTIQYQSNGCCVGPNLCAFSDFSVPPYTVPPAACQNTESCCCHLIAQHHQLPQPQSTFLKPTVAEASAALALWSNMTPPTTSRFRWRSTMLQSIGVYSKPSQRLPRAAWWHNLEWKPDMAAISAHACNLSYLGCWGRRIMTWDPAWATWWECVSKSKIKKVGM